MANHLDLEEQEQLDQLKHFWKQYGNPITWLLIAVLGGVAAWNGYQYWQRSQSLQAAAMFDEFERVARSGDLQKTERAFSDMKERFASTAYAQQAGLQLARSAYVAGNTDIAKDALTWISEKSSDKGYAAIARLRLASLLVEAKAYDEALTLLSRDVTQEFSALSADRRGDILAAQGKTSEAKLAYQKAYAQFEDPSEYRRLVDVKLNALGLSSSAVSATASGDSVKTGGSK